jgi:hypothetical protein
MKPEFFCGLDLGQAQDFTALCILERVRIAYGEVNTDLVQPTRTELHCRHLGRLALGTSYPAVVTHITRLLETPPLKGNATLVIDHTGCGRPVFDMFEAGALTCSLYGISITSGDSVTWEGQHIRVPKRDLIAATQVHLQNGDLKIASSLPHTQPLVTELLNFRVKIDPVTAHESYSAWRENMHDDLVLAVAMATWMSDQTIPIQFIKLLPF